MIEGSPDPRFELPSRQSEPQAMAVKSDGATAADHPTHVHCRCAKPFRRLVEREHVGSAQSAVPGRLAGLEHWLFVHGCILRSTWRREALSRASGVTVR